MVSRKDIKANVDSMVSCFSLEYVVLFGSYAKGTPNEDSDVDMPVIMDHDQRKDVEQAVAIDVQPLLRNGYKRPRGIMV